MGGMIVVGVLWVLLMGLPPGPRSPGGGGAGARDGVPPPEHARGGDAGGRPPGFWIGDAQSAALVLLPSPRPQAPRAPRAAPGIANGKPEPLHNLRTNTIV